MPAPSGPRTYPGPAGGSNHADDHRLPLLPTYVYHRLPPFTPGSRMRLKEYLRPDFVLARLEARDVEGVLREVSVAADAAGVGPRDLIERKLLEREREHPTVLGAGLAIPHATVPGLERPALGVALAEEPVTFGPADLDPVRVFFVLLTPPGFEREHVKLLARICRLARYEDLVDRLAASQSGPEILETLETIDGEHV